MSINTSWQIQIGALASKTDFTSRVLSMNIDQKVDVNVIGRGVCTFTLLNKDGALTPGGGGTYSSTDWFAQGVFVSCLTNTGGADTTNQVFHGVITDFDLVDDGVFSTVTITALDGLTVGGRTPNVKLAVALTTNYSVVAPAVLGNGYAAGYAINYLRLGASTAVPSWTNLGSADPQVTTDVSIYTTAADLWQTATIPAVNDVMWATTITGTTTATYSVVSIPSTNSRALANQTEFYFDQAASLSGTELPFDIDTFQQSFNNETLVTNAEIKGVYAGATTASASSTTVNTYGSRTQSFTNTYVADSTAASSEATLLVNRYGNTRFSPTSLQTSSNLVKTLASDSALSKWQSLLDVTSGLWQRLTVTWTGSGASTQTAYCVIKGRRISVDPAQTIVTLSLGNWSDNHGFILDTDFLDQDRLG
jgi:hypothetical protein